MSKIQIPSALTNIPDIALKFVNDYIDYWWVAVLAIIGFVVYVIWFAG